MTVVIVTQPSIVTKRQSIKDLRVHSIVVSLFFKSFFILWFFTKDLWILSNVYIRCGYGRLSKITEITNLSLVYSQDSSLLYIKIHYLCWIYYGEVDLLLTMFSYNKLNLWTGVFLGGISFLNFMLTTLKWKRVRRSS